MQGSFGVNEQLKSLMQTVLLGRPLMADDFEVLSDTVLSGELDSVAVACEILVASGRPGVELLVSIADRLDLDRQQAAILFLASSEFASAYQWMLTCLHRRNAPDQVMLLKAALAKTAYFVFPLLVIAIGDSDRRFVEDIKDVLRMMGWAKVAPFLAMFPEIPHEREFRDSYGDTNIDSLHRGHQ